MNNFEFKIYPNLTITKKIVRAEVTIIEIKLFQSARIGCLLYDEDNKIQQSHQLILDQTNGYDNWTTDKWLLDWVKKQINVI